MLLVMPHDASKLLDINNIVALDDRTIIGFVYEPVGPVTNPLYSI